MSVQYDSSRGSILAGAALVANRLVKYDGTYCAVSTVRNHAGITQEAQPTTGKPVTVRKPGCNFSDKVETAAAISAGAAVYYDTNGRIGTTSASNTQVGIALTAASGAGSVIEVLFFG
jgi:Uncharacterized conserved protein (DUF2190)